MCPVSFRVPAAIVNSYVYISLATGKSGKSKAMLLASHAQTIQTCPSQATSPSIMPSCTTGNLALPVSPSTSINISLSVLNMRARSAPPMALPVPYRAWKSRTSEEQYPSNAGLFRKRSKCQAGNRSRQHRSRSEYVGEPPAPLAAVDITPHHVLSGGRSRSDHVCVDGAHH